MGIKTTAVAGTLESSDIQIMIMNGNNGIKITLESDVAKAYGDQIKSVITDTLKPFGLTNTKVKTVDKGTLDCVIKARTLTAVQRATQTTDKPTLEVLQMTYIKNRLRRTMILVPSNNPAMVKGTGIYGADSIMLDLEDSVSLTEKDTAHLLVYEAIKTVDFGGSEVVVRVNGQDAPFYEEDVKIMVKAGVDVIRLPKTESADMIKKLTADMEKTEEEYGIEKGSIGVMAAIESVQGVLNAPSIATSTDLMMGMALSGGDYTSDMHTHHYPDGREMEFARNMVLHSCRTAGIYAFDSVFPNMKDIEGFYHETNYIHRLGFNGRSLINPRQIQMVNKVFNPSKEEVENAKDIQNAIREARAKGDGVISMNGKMVDKPIVGKVNRVLETAKASNLIDEEGNYIGE